MSVDASGGDVTDAPAAGSTRVPWYQRRAVLLVGGVVVVLAIAIVTDLPTPTTHAADVASAAAFVKEVNTDLRACGFALEEAYGFREDQLHGSLTSSERAQLPQLLSDDAVACSYIDPSITDLTSLESPETTAAQPIGQMVATATLWVTADALGAIEAIEALRTHPTNAAAMTTLDDDTARLARDRASARASIAQANAQLDTHVLGVDLPEVALPSLSSAHAAT